jgi:hypothetical protein
MSHYAKVVNGIVTQVITAEADFFKSFVDTSPGAWIQTSYNTVGGKHLQGGIPLRANYAGVGYIYDAKNDVFYAPRPVDRNNISCASWTLSAPTWIWNPPVAMPTDGKLYAWDEPTKTWIAQ